MIFTFFSFQEIPRSHLKCSSILGSLAKRPREDQLILVSICVSAALTLGLIVFVAVHCRRQMKSCFDPRGLVSIENNTPNHRLRTPRANFFFRESQTFGLGQTNCAEIFWVHLGCFWLNYNTYLGTVSPFSMVLSMWLFFLQKNFGFQA
jgi:hypothetical protein